MRLSHELSEALRPTTTYSWADDQVYTGLVEDSDWMGEALRQFRAVAPKHVAYLKKLTGMNWKLFKHPLSENGRLRLRFDMAKRGDLLEDPMIVVRLAYSAAADVYNAQIEVWRDPGTKIGGYETTDVDVEMLADAERFFYGARKFLGQLGKRTEDVDLAEARIAVDASLFSRREPGERADPSKPGPAAERAATLKMASRGIERMLSALETVRGWVKKLDLGTKDKTGAAAAALKMAAAEIIKAESVQSVLGDIIDLPPLQPVADVELWEAGEDLNREKARDGLWRMIDGLNQLHGILRQGKIGGRVLRALDAAVEGLKITIDAMDEGMEEWTRVKAAQVRRGDIVRGGSAADPVCRRVDRVLRHEDDMSYVVLGFDEEYRGSDGRQHTTALYHRDAVLSVSRSDRR